jgi:hypothetical protein
MRRVPRPAHARAPSPLAHASALALALAFALALVAGCDKPGQDCSDSPGGCYDKKSHLVCVNKKFVLETCKGAGACNDKGKTLVCDNTIAEIGDGCGHEGSRACATDGTKELRCRDGKMQIEWACRGGCKLDDNSNPKCTPTGEAGETCRPDSIVCDGAQHTELVCTDGKFVPRRTCHGARGCETPPGGGVLCDRTQALENEKCHEEDVWACDMDKKNVLICNMGLYTTQIHCLGPRGCELPGNYSVRCDKTTVPENEACDEPLSHACTPDGQQVVCTDGKFVIDKKWKPKKDETCLGMNHYTKNHETARFEAR